MENYLKYPKAPHQEYLLNGCIREYLGGVLISKLVLFLKTSLLSLTTKCSDLDEIRELRREPQQVSVLILGCPFTAAKLSKSLIMEEQNRSRKLRLTPLNE